MCCSPNAGCVCSTPVRAAGRRSSVISLQRLTGRRQSLLSPPPGGAAGSPPGPASKLASPPPPPPERPAEVQSDADPGPAPAADAPPCQRVYDNVDEQTKRELRTGRLPLDQAARAQLWRAICRYHGVESGADDEYRETVQQMEGEYAPPEGPQVPRPPLMHPFYSNHYELDRSGVWAAERLMAVLHYNNPAMAYSPPLFSICCLLLHYLDEAEVYSCLSMMLKNSNLGFIVQTKRQCEISWRTLVKLCRKHAKGSMRFLQQHARNGEDMRNVLADWMAWIFCFLPFAHVIRLFDCFLMEGEKVLYRGAMALVVLLHKHASRQNTGEKAGLWADMLAQHSVQDVMKTFCQQIPVTPQKLLKTMFNIRAFSRVTLKSSYMKAKEQIRADGGRLSFPERTLDKSPSTEPRSHHGLPSLKSQQEMERCSSTIGIKEPSGVMFLLTFRRAALQLLQLWERLPSRFALHSPLLLYTSNEHGFSLKTFYQRVAEYEPTVLLLRTTEGAVFGAYCSSSWNTRNKLMEDGSRHAYFGTGETFLFTLRPELKVYPWTGARRQAENPELASVERHRQLFMAADNTMLMIGGGGGQAIWLDENLSRGKTEACATFDNPPLTESGSFDVACMEAFGFAPS